MFEHWIDHTDRLGFVKMPNGYKLYQLMDSGHFFWYREEDEQESSIHWDKWSIYKSAKLYSEAEIYEI